MSMKFAPLIDPAVRKPAPKPVRVDLRKVFAIGTGGLQRNAVGDYVRGRRHYWLATAGLGILRPLGLPPPRTVTQHKLPLMTGAVSVAD